MRRLASLAAAAALAAATPLRAQQGTPPSAGYVSALEGAWVLYGPGTRGRSPVRLGMSVPEGAVIAFAGDTPASARIVVRRYAGEPVVRECSRAGCGEPLRVRAGGRGDGRVRRIMEAVAGLLVGQPEHYHPLISRGDEGWAPAVLALRGDSVDLGPVLAGTPAPLALRLIPLPPDTGGARAPLRLDWRSGTPTAGGASPGLYRLVSLHSPPRETWVLLLPPDQAARAAERLREAAALVGSWGPDAWAEGDAFLRAWLHYLALHPAP